MADTNQIPSDDAAIMSDISPDIVSHEIYNSSDDTEDPTGPGGQSRAMSKPMFRPSRSLLRPRQIKPPGGQPSGFIPNKTPGAHRIP